MAESSIFKRQKAKPSLWWKEEDKISSLPDCLLIHILSFLPTKTSVATCLLSRRWRHIWKHLSVLYFSDNYFKFDYAFAEWHDAQFQIFQTLASFVNNVFLLRMPYKVQKMCLSCTRSLADEVFCTSSVNKWVQSVIGPDLKELNLTLYSIDTRKFKLPIASACTNLVSLSLEGEMDFDLQCFKGIRLPSLKMLKLFIWPMAMPSINSLISCCPILQTLEIYISIENYKKICVPPTLKTVKIIGSIVDDKPSLELRALVFDNLNITQITSGDVGNLQNVVKASLDVFPSSSDCALLVYLPMLLTALSGIKHLALSNSATKLLLRGAAILPFPEFRHLLHLEITLPCFNSNFLFSLLHKCHLLQVLIIQNDKEQSPDLSEWDTQPSIPRCIVSSLTFIQFKGYRGFPDDLLFAEYMLQKGLTLKTMTIDGISVDQTKKKNILKRLSKVSRASGM